MKETSIEQKLVQETKAQGGLALKFVSPGTDGMPDRIILMPSGKVAFVEVKRSGEKPRPLQRARHQRLRALGFPVYVLDDPTQIGGILRAVQAS